jgi:hypothetical protein
VSKAALYQKIVKVMNDVGQLQKDGNVVDTNGRKMYAYLSEEQTTGELQKAFIKHGLVMFPTNVESEVIYLESVKHDKIVKAPITKVIVTYKICDSETGESEDLMSMGYGSDSQDKGSNKAMTGAFKYVQRQTFCISTGDDGDHVGSDELDRQYSRPAASQQPRTQTQGNTSQNAQAGNTGQSSAPQRQSNASVQSRVYKLREEMGWSWDDLSAFAGEVLGREVKYLKSHVKTDEEWLEIEKQLLVTRQAS